MLFCNTETTQLRERLVLSFDPAKYEAVVDSSVIDLESYNERPMKIVCDNCDYMTSVVAMTIQEEQ